MFSLLAIVAKIMAGKMTIHLVCSGNSYMMLDKSEKWKKNCKTVVLFED